jgi:pyruvate dehydrogenase E2 component (dihydrolipoamide acetyltransferase)
MIDDVLKYKRLDGVSELLGSLAAGLFPGGRQVELPGTRLLQGKPPVTVIWGRDDHVISAAHASLAPAGASVHVFDGAGHMVQLERANEVNRLLVQHVGG